jgi:hypothetical protein
MPVNRDPENLSFYFRHLVYVYDITLKHSVQQQAI